MTEGHGLDEFLAKLAAIPNAVHVTARLAPGGTTMVQSSFPSDPDRDLEQLAVKVSEVLARRQDGRL